MSRTNRKLFCGRLLKSISFLFAMALTLPIALPQSGSRIIRAVNISAAPGSNASVPIELASQGNENALGFSLTYNTALLSAPQVVLGSGAGGASLNVNANENSQGRLGIAVALPAGQTFSAGTRQIVVVTFSVASAASGSATIGFGDQPIVREVSDALATALAASYTSGQVAFSYCEISQLWSVDGATPGKTSSLWALVKNNAGTALPSGATVWFYVEGPGWSNNWVGSAAVGALAAGSSQWFWYDWLIPSTATPGNYSYKAQVWTTSAISGWSSSQAFVVSGSSLPGKATQISPTGTISTALPTYTWYAVANATWYLLWVNDSTMSYGKIQKWYTAAEAGCSSGTGTCTATPSTSLAAGAAQWWIQTYNSAGYGPWSDGLIFTVGSAGPPGKATLVSPTGTIATTTPTYTWTAVTGSTWYFLYVSDSRSREKILKWYTAAEVGCASGAGNCTVKPDVPLAPGAAQWWIQTWNDSGTGPWSDGVSFIVGSGSARPD